MNERNDSISKEDFDELSNCFFILDNSVRSPIGTIHGFASFLLEEKNLTESDREESLKIIIRETNKLENNLNIFSTYFGVISCEKMGSDILTLQDTVAFADNCENVKLFIQDEDILVRCDKFYLSKALIYLTNPYMQDSYNASISIHKESTNQIQFQIGIDISINDRRVLAHYALISANMIIEKHGSLLEVAIKEDKTTFKFTLPIVQNEIAN